MANPNNFHLGPKWLLRNGYVRVGEFKVDTDGMNVAPKPIHDGAGVWAIALEGRIVYVGYSMRMADHVTHGTRHGACSTIGRIKEKITRALRYGLKVELYTSEIAKPFLAPEEAQSVRTIITTLHVEKKLDWRKRA